MLIFLVASLLLVAAAAWGLSRYLDTPLGLAADNYLLDVPEGSALISVLSGLSEARVIGYPQLLSGYARWQGLAARIQAGEYQLNAQLTPRTLLDMLVAGRVRLHAFTIVEGWTVWELLTALREDATLVQTLSATNPETLAAELGLDYAHAEGQFLPETYMHARGMSDRELLLRAHQLLRERLAAVWQARADGLPLADEQAVLVLASLIERETALPSERPIISGVFTRRLQLGMRLQTDPAVIYGLLPGFNGNLTRRDLRRDTPYNTYTRGGLPPTPIAMAGEASLRAAVAPAAGDALYFVATGLADGSHVFTATLDEHNAAVARYLARLRGGNNGG